MEGIFNFAGVNIEGYNLLYIEVFVNMPKQAGSQTLSSLFFVLAAVRINRKN